MQEIEHALERARAWSAELEEVVQARANLTGAVLGAAILAVGLIILVVGAISPWLLGGTAVRSATVGFWQAGIGMALALFVRGRRVQSGWWTVLVVALVLLATLPVWVNGSIALVLGIAMMAVLHLLLPPGPALGSCVAMLGIWGVGLATTAAPVDPQVALRAFAASITLVVLMQLLMRHVARVNAAAAQLSGEVGAEVRRLNEALTAAQREAERLARLDAATGVQSEAAVAALLRSGAPPADLLPGADATAGEEESAEPAVPVIALRFTRWDEALLALDGTQRQALQEALGARLREVFGADAVIGRRSASDFLALLPSARGDLANLTALRGLQARLERPFAVGGHSIVLAPALGVAVWPEDGAALHAVVADAEVARAVAARAAVREPVRYAPRMLRHLATRSELASQILEGISAGEFVMHYQPIMSVADGTVRKAEALLRWRHPVLGLISPGEFLDVAEEGGLLRSLTDWIGAQVAAELAPLQAALGPGFRVAVNVPPEVLVWWAEDPMGLITQSQGLGLRGDGLVLEVTENAFLNPSPGVLRILQAARSAGALVAIDDFGTGFSSLGRLLALPVDILKLDRALAVGIAGDPRREAIVRAVVGLARDLGLRVVAEGIERIKDVDALRAIGCHDIQGFQISPPVAAAELAETIRRIEASRA